MKAVKYARNLKTECWCREKPYGCKAKECETFFEVPAPLWRQYRRAIADMRNGNRKGKLWRELDKLDKMEKGK